MIKPKRKTQTISERLKILEQTVKRQERKIKELEREIRKMDLDEITEVPKLNLPISQ